MSIHCLRVVSLDAEIRGPQKLENQISCEQDVGNVSSWWFQCSSNWIISLRLGLKI